MTNSKTQSKLEIITSDTTAKLSFISGNDSACMNVNELMQAVQTMCESIDYLKRYERAHKTTNAMIKAAVTL